jgi:hypothetical protein
MLSLRAIAKQSLYLGFVTSFLAMTNLVMHYLKIELVLATTVSLTFPSSLGEVVSQGPIMMAHRRGLTSATAGMIS